MTQHPRQIPILPVLVMSGSEHERNRLILNQLLNKKEGEEGKPIRE
jgi:hypothetical protein